MSVPRDGRHPEVYARLAEEAERDLAAHPPPPWSRWAGRLICLALAAAVVAGALGANPW